MTDEVGGTWMLKVKGMKTMSPKMSMNPKCSAMISHLRIVESLVLDGVDPTLISSNNHSDMPPKH